MNAEGRMQKAELRMGPLLNSKFCIQHSAFCIHMTMNENTLTKIDPLRDRLASVRSYL